MIPSRMSTTLLALVCLQTTSSSSLAILKHLTNVLLFIINEIDTQINELGQLKVHLMCNSLKYDAFYFSADKIKRFFNSDKSLC